MAREREVGERHRAFEGKPPGIDLQPKPGVGLYDNDGPTQFLIDTCKGVEAVDRAPARVGVRAVAILEAAWRSALDHRPVAVDVA
jgi:hypothetical protein